MDFLSGILRTKNNGAVGTDKKTSRNRRTGILRQTVAPAYRITRFRLTLRKAFKESGFLFA